MDNPLVQPDPGLFIWTILTFLVLVGLLAKFAWRPLLEALERRQATIAKALDDAKLARQELERLQRESAEMMRQANDISYGLAGGIWTKDLSRAHKLARSLETGMIWINRYLNLKPNQWIGGHKASGFGTEGVRATMDHYTVMKSVVINL